MQLVLPVDLLPPSICIVCETQPDGEAVVDTLYNFKPGVASVLNGRKYVCERCVGEFARLFGFERGNHVQQAQWERDQATREIAVIRQRIEEFAGALSDVVNHPGLIGGASFDDVFTPPALDRVREAAASRASQIGSAPQDKAKPAALRKRTERPAVPSPGLTVQEEAPVDNVDLTKNQSVIDEAKPAEAADEPKVEPGEGS
jgi:hypothetical protein